MSKLNFLVTILTVTSFMRLSFVLSNEGNTIENVTNAINQAEANMEHYENVTSTTEGNQTETQHSENSTTTEENRTASTQHFENLNTTGGNRTEASTQYFDYSTTTEGIKSFLENKSIVDDDRILKGRRARKGEIPFIVALSDKPDHVFCGGSILSPLYVVTACHCVTKSGLDIEGNRILKPRPYHNIRVIAGSLSRSPNEEQGYQLRWIFYMIHHPECSINDFGELFYDVGIIKVTEPFYFNKLIRPARIPVRPKKFTEIVESLIEHEYKCYVAGWGANATEIVTKIVDNELKKEEIVLSASKYLKTLNSKLIPNPICYKYRLCGRVLDFLEKIHCTKKLLEEGTPKLCAWAENKNNGTACFGDSGGPLVCGNILVGIVSYGNACFYMKDPVVFARVDKVFPFLSKYYHKSPSYSARSGAPALEKGIIVILWMILSLKL